MSSIRVSGNTSGHYDLTVPDVAGSNTIALDKIVVSDSNGNVGIGADSSSYSSYRTIIKRDDSSAWPSPAAGGSSGEAVLALINDNTSSFTYSNLVLRAGTGDCGIAAVYQNSANNSDLVFYTDAGSNGSEQMRLTHEGDVGIGITNPSAALHVKARANQEPLTLGISSNGWGYITFQNATPSDVAYLGLGGGAAVTTGSYSDFAIRSNANLLFGAGSNGERMRIDSNGKVGIGTDSPSATLDVVSNSASGYVAEFRESNASNFGTIVIDSPSDGSSRPSYMDYATGGTVKWSTGLAYNDTARAFHIGTGSGLSNSKVTIKPDGKVGIGTTSPDRALHIEGSDFASSTIRLKRTDGGANNDAGLQFQSAAGANADTGLGGIWFQNSLDGNAYALIRARTDDSTGTSGRLDFMTSTSLVNNSSTPSLTIKSSGIVTMDYQPSANVFANSGNAGAYNNASSNGDIVATGIRHNIGSHYNASNGRFTCPTSGRYFVSFSANWYNNSAGSWIRPSIRRNGTTITQHYESTANNPTWMHIGASAILDCSTGDYLTIHNGTNSGAGGGMDVGAYSNINFHKIA